MANWPGLPDRTPIDPADFTNMDSFILRGDIRSYNWDGGSDLSGGADASATAGFYLDSSAGTAQFQNIIGEGGTFTNVTVSGTITAGAGSDVDWSYVSNVSIVNADIVSLSFDKITAATNTASLSVGSSGYIQSSNYSAGTTGFRVNGDGSAEFNNVTVRGTVYATAGVIGNLTVDDNLTMTTGGLLRTGGGSVNRMEIGYANPQFITWKDAANNTDFSISFQSGPSDLGSMTNSVGFFSVIVDLVQTGNGSAGQPSFGFRNETNTGIYKSGTNQLAFAVAGTRAAYFDSGQSLNMTDNIIYNVGELRMGATTGYIHARDDKYGFWNASTTYMTYVSTNTIAFVTNNQDVFRLDGNRDVYIPADLPDVGSVNQALFNRSGSTTALVQLGYTTSWITDPETGHPRKHRIVPLASPSKWWNRDWFMDLEPIKFERVKKQPGRKTAFVKRPIEFGFGIENLIQHTNLLTVGGAEVGDSPHHDALLAVTVDFVQNEHRERTADRERIVQLEKRLAALERNMV